MKLPAHGANPHYLYDSLCVSQPELVIDFSTNVNPFGPPEKLRTLWPSFFQTIQDYPDPNTIQLRKMLAEQIGVSEEHILLGNGGAEIIHLVANMLSKRKVLIIHPAFSEYEAACQASGCQIFRYMLSEGKWELSSKELLKQLDEVDAVFLCTPNNPTGVVYEASEVTQLLDACVKRNVFLIIDEAFYDFYQWGETASFARYVSNNPHVLIIRSLTKMYAIAGLRLGYVIAHPDIVRNLSLHQPHWSVNQIALKAGEVCLAEADFVTKTVEKVAKERARLFHFFKENQFVFSNSKVNYYLLRDQRIQDQQPLLIFLLKKGIVPRHTKNFPGLSGRWLRFAIKRKQENNYLLEALTEWRRKS